MVLFWWQGTGGPGGCCWIDMIDEILRSSGSGLLSALFILGLITISAAPSALGAKDFPAFRLQQFDLHSQHYGSSGSVLNFEARVLPGSEIVSSPRRVYVIKLVDLTIALYQELLKKVVAGIMIMIPEDTSAFSEDTIEHIQELEKEMLRGVEPPLNAHTIPVYFVRETEVTLSVYHTIKETVESMESSVSTFQAMLFYVHGNGVQLVTSSQLSSPKIMTDAYVTSIQGALLASKSERNFPILVATHYDSMSPAAELSFGADSNGSGTASLIELARLFSHLYRQKIGTSGTSGWTGKGRPASSLLFLLSGAGQFNYAGTQKYLEDQVDSSESSELTDTRLVVCLDSLSGVKNHLYIHVSRSIREGTMLSTFIKNLMSITKELYPELMVQLVQRKVRTESLLSWEHEKFHLKKINAVTLSAFDSPVRHRSLLDTTNKINITDLSKKSHIIAEALAASIYNVSDMANTFSGSLQVSEESLKSVLDYIGSVARSAQLLASKQNKFVQSLRSLLARYTHETSVFSLKSDSRDSNLVFYDSTGGVITAYDVKPALFDLILSAAIAAYIFLIYLAIKQFPNLYDVICHSSQINSSNGVSRKSS